MRKVTEQACKAFINGNHFKLGNTQVVVDYHSASKTNTMLLHGHAIAIKSDRLLYLDSCNWKTPTTKERLNGILNAFNLPYSISQVKGQWYIHGSHSENDSNYITPIEWTGSYTFQV